MKTGLAALALAVSPALAIPPPNFGFPEAPNDTALTVTYPQGNGRYIPVTEAELFGINVPQNQPVVAVNTSAYRSLANYSGNYVLIMVDPDAQYPENPNYRFYLHWMQANLTQSNNSTMNQSLSLTGNRQLVNMSAPVVPYARPAPPTNSSAHRYIFYSFQQPDNFSIPSQWSGLNAMNRTKFNLTNFIADTNLGTPAAANFMYVSNQSRVPDDFVAAAGSQYPGGDGTAVTSGDPSQATGGSSGSGSGSNSGSGSGGSGNSGSNGGSGGSSSSTSSAGAAMITGAGSLLGAGILGFAALI